MPIQTLAAWIIGVRLSRRYSESSQGRIICRGRVQLSLAGSAVISPTKGESFLGIPLFAGTPRTATTVLSVGTRAELIVTEATIGRGCSVVLGPNAVCHIGRGTYIADGSRIWATSSIRVGSSCAVSFGVTIIDDDGHGFGPPPYSQPVTIGDDVWIGCNVTILKGVTIGSGSAIAAGTVVNKSCPPRSLVGGVPGKIIRTDIRWTDSARTSTSASLEQHRSQDAPYEVAELFHPYKS